jgi:hypothetical protein
MIRVRHLAAEYHSDGSLTNGNERDFALEVNTMFFGPRRPFLRLDERDCRIV